MTNFTHVVVGLYASSWLKQFEQESVKTNENCACEDNCILLLDSKLVIERYN